MKQLKNCVELSCSIKIYVPSTIEVDKVFDSKEYVDKTLIFLSSLFGGSTATIALGAWVSSQGELIKENVTLVTSYCHQNSLEKHMGEIYDFCINLKLDLKQESIALEVNNKLYLI